MRKEIQDIERVLDVQTQAINTQTNLIQNLQKELGKKANECRVNDWVAFFNAFKNKVEAYPKISITPCKKCGHETLHKVTTYNPFESTCLNCGTVWLTTSKLVTEVKESKK